MNLEMSYPEIICDFDGTITKSDVVDSFLDQFATPEWLEIEALWRNRKIGSRECLERQIACVPRISAEKMQNFLNSIEIDPYFLEFASRLKRGRITIVSDGFDIFIQSVIDRYGLTGIRYYSNRLVPSVGRAGFKAEFPYASVDCKMASGTCKCKIAAQLVPGCHFAFVGDGQSDFCVSHQAGMVFAKGKLAAYCRAQGIPCIEFTNFQTITEHYAEIAV